MKSVFQLIDEREDVYLGFKPFSVFSNISMWRKYFTLCTILAAFFWAVFGFDGTWSQMTELAKVLPDVLVGNMSITDAWIFSRTYYGMGNHFSAPVIYGLFFVFLSKHLERVGIEKSENFSITTLISLFSIGIFEIVYNLCYALFQGQIWAITFRYKQIYNLTMFSMFTIFGFVAITYLIFGNYKFNLSKKTQILFIFTLVMWYMWIAYPFPLTSISVNTAQGVWTSSRWFPQTFYAVDIDATDGIAIGVPYYVNNELLHLVNTATKFVSTAFMLSLFKFKIKENNIKNIEVV